MMEFENDFLLCGGDIRIKIAKYFGADVDSATIWPVDYKKWCELNDAVDGFWDKVEEVKKHG